MDTSRRESPVALLEDLLDLSGTGLAVFDPGQRLVHANQALRDAFGLGDDAEGVTVAELAGVDAATLDTLFEKAHAEGVAEALLAWETSTTEPRRTLSLTARPLTVDGTHVGLVVEDVSDTVEEQQFLTGLHDISDSLLAAVSSAELEDAIVENALIVPGAVGVHLVVADPESDRPRVVELTGASVVRRPLDPDGDRLIALPFETRQWHTYSRSELTDEMSRPGTDGSTAVPTWLLPEAVTLAAGPLVHRGDVLGTLAWQLGASDGGRVGAWEILRSYASSVRVALGSMARQELDRRLAVSYQRSLLPESLPECPGLEIGADYRSAIVPERSGGDWYDVVQRRDGATVLIVGDAVGHGITAAVHMGHVRDLTRSAALETTTPSEILAQVDTHIRELGERTMAAVTVAVVAPGQCRLSVACAGQPPGMLRTASRAVSRFDAQPGPFVGSGFAVDYTEAELDLEPGDTVVLFSDGLVERPGSQIDEGLDGVEEMIAGSERDAGRVCSALMDMVGDDSDDDVVVLVARRQPE